ncbi:MAG: hypothetical protein AUG49_24135 [Catenulispora sp. 13_1_20CM_3_70_7]|nr:MAG: hypothetical protein AUG49_24135 [Catenulispora sp. 13_1_20CM_3_70_7]
MSTGEDVQLTELPVGAKVGSGGQGDVFVINRSLLYKKYHQPSKVDGGALSQLVSRYATPRWVLQRRWIDRTCAWPKCRVLDRGQVVGYVMAFAGDRFFWRDGKENQRLLELQYLVRPAKKMWGQIRQPTAPERVALAAAVADLVRRLHSMNFVIGDVSHANVLWTLEGGPGVYLLDCDSLQIGDRHRVTEPASTPDWDDPRQAPRVPPTRDNDNYKLALAVGRILAQRPDVRPGERLEPVPGMVQQDTAKAIQRLFDQAAGPSRPSAHEWLSALPMNAIGVSAPQTTSGRPGGTRPSQYMSAKQHDLYWNTPYSENNK